MTADLTTYNKALLERMAPNILKRLQMLTLASPEWRAWAKAWRESVPLTQDQERENAEWRSGLATARAALTGARQVFDAAIESIEQDFHVKVVVDEDGEYDIDDLMPPHVPTYRTKDGAPPEPPMWPRGGGTVRFRRFGDQP